MHGIVEKTEGISRELDTARALMMLILENFSEEMPNSEDEKRGWKLEAFCRRQDLFQALLDTVYDKLNLLSKTGDEVRDEMYVILKENNKEGKVA